MGQMKKLALDNVKEDIDHQGANSPNGHIAEPQDDTWKCIATMESDGSKIVVDSTELALLLAAVYAQPILKGDWNKHRGDLFVFADNPVVRTCVALWRDSIIGSGQWTTMERYLFSLLEISSHDFLYEIEAAMMERRNG